MRLENKKLLLLGGSRNMKEILDAARSLGVFVGVTDWYDTRRSPVKAMADAYYDISIEDTEILADLIAREGYEGVLTGYADSYLLPYARLCDRAGLPCYGTEEQMRLLTDKSLYKQLFKEHDVPTLPFYEAQAIGRDFADFPLLLKPVKGSGGKGLIKVDNYQAFQEAKNLCLTRHPQEDYLIEPYFADRKELTAFFLFIDGQVSLTGTANRFLSRPQGDRIALPVLYSFSSSYDSVFREVTAPPMIRMLEDLGLKNGMLFAQCILHEGIPKVYDLGYRLTGTLEYKLQEALFGFNPLKMMVRHSLTGQMLAPGEAWDPARLTQSDTYGFNVTILGKEGTIARIEGGPQIMAIPSVKDCVFKLVEGDRISRDMIGTLGQIVARIFFTAEDLEEAAGILDQIYRQIRVLNDRGEDMILDRYKPQDLASAYL